jgi:hypothetical protein
MPTAALNFHVCVVFIENGMLAYYVHTLQHGLVEAVIDL